jgi:quinoprotein dehydrogenase-associated probable ABC transporter substrate-binding protein
VQLPLCVIFLAGCSREPEKVFRVCADPNNLPFSNQKGEGFENKIAGLIAKDIGARLEYTWFAQRRGFIRNTLGAGQCDVVMGVPADYEMTLTTRPYYRSSYVFLSRQDQNLDIASMDDPRLATLRLGVHVIGDDYANPPPMHALARRHIVQNVAGYSIYGDYSQPNPPARLVEAVAKNEIDVAIVWGPFAGYFGRNQSVALHLQPVSPEVDEQLPFVYDISMGVRRSDKEKRRILNDLLDRRQSDIDGILRSYGVPLKPLRRR